VENGLLAKGCATAQRRYPHDATYACDVGLATAWLIAPERNRLSAFNFR
jgi:hypothetical protein